MRFIISALEKLSLIDLTNRNEVLSFRVYLIRQGTHLFEWHMTNHHALCDCRETERTLELFNCMINYLDQLLRNNNF